MMMLAVMYGMIPKAKMEKLPNAPPENKFKNPSAPCESEASRNWRTACASIPGARSADPKRYKAIIAKVNKTLLRRSSTLKMFFTFDNIVGAPVLEARRRTGATSLSVSELVALSGWTWALVRHWHDRYRTTSSKNCLLSSL